jgi:epsilon-lactone hydrolase
MSLRGRIANFLVRVVVKRWPKNDPAALVRRARKIFGEPKLVRSRPLRGIKIEKVEGPVRGEWLTPSQVNFPDAVLLYLHGGGYVSCSPESHRPITAYLARAIGCRVFSLDYRIAPEHPFPAAVEDAVAAVHWLLQTGIKAENIALAGDSAGGGLCVATLLRLRDQGTPLPCCAACISPWVDLAGELPLTNEKSCSMFFPEDGKAFALVYLNGASPKDPMASPLHGDLKGLPPLLIQAASGELLFDDANRLHEKALKSGVKSVLHVYEGLPHVWQMMVGTVPEAGQALDEIADFVKKELPAATSSSIPLRRHEEVKSLPIS